MSRIDVKRTSQIAVTFADGAANGFKATSSFNVAGATRRLESGGPPQGTSNILTVSTEPTVRMRAFEIVNGQKIALEASRAFAAGWPKLF
jgi:hypothetical protein